MLRKLSIALLLATSPALANDPAPATSAEAPAPEFKIKKVCRTVEVAGSFIPRTHCVNKKVPIKKPEAQAEQGSTADGTAADGSGEQKD